MLPQGICSGGTLQVLPKLWTPPATIRRDDLFEHLTTDPGSQRHGLNLGPPTLGKLDGRRPPGGHRQGPPHPPWAGGAP